MVNSNTSPQDNAETAKPISEGIAGLEKYVGLIGLGKQAAIDAMGEKPCACDEAGLRFKKANINIWFEAYDHTKQVEQVCVLESKLDFNGIKFGDDISNFDEIFGKPEHEHKQAYSNYATRYYKYKDVFLSIGYDTATNKTYKNFYIQKKLFDEKN